MSTNHELNPTAEQESDPTTENGESESVSATEESPVDEEARITALEEQISMLKNKVLRGAADFDNYRKRTKRDVSDAERRGAGNAIREILPVMDNLERAVSASKDAKDTNAIAEGVQMVLRQFQDVGERIDLLRVPTLGEQFDPNLHEAVQQVPTDEHPIGTILEEVQPGYQYRERLLRAAMVVVARPIPKEAPEEDPVIEATSSESKINEDTGPRSPESEIEAPESEIEAG